MLRSLSDVYSLTEFRKYCYGQIRVRNYVENSDSNWMCGTKKHPVLVDPNHVKTMPHHFGDTKGLQTRVKTSFLNWLIDMRYLSLVHIIAYTIRMFITLVNCIRLRVVWLMHIGASVSNVRAGYI